MHVTKATCAAHYIVFHPDRNRIRTRVRATVIREGLRTDGWEGYVWLDKPPGNEDPYVLGSTWVYSYCHATQLRRKCNSNAYLTHGSCIVFCSGTIADRESELAIDTVFLVKKAHPWQPPRTLPMSFQADAGMSDLWKYHLQFGCDGGPHEGRMTYEAIQHADCGDRYSCLPLDVAGDRVRVPFARLSRTLRDPIEQNLQGKRPVLLNDEQNGEILAAWSGSTQTAVVGDVTPIDSEFLRLRRDSRLSNCQAC